MLIFRGVNQAKKLVAKDFQGLLYLASNKTTMMLSDARQLRDKETLNFIQIEGYPEDSCIINRYESEMKQVIWITWTG